MPRYKRQFRNGGTDPTKRRSPLRPLRPIDRVPDPTKPVAKSLPGQRTIMPGQNWGRSAARGVRQKNSITGLFEPAWKMSPSDIKEPDDLGAGIKEHKGRGAVPRRTGQPLSRAARFGRTTSKFAKPLGAVGTVAGAMFPEELGAPGIDHSYLEGIDLNTFEALDANDFQEPSLPVGHGVLLHDGMINEDTPVGSKSPSPTQTRTTNEPADVFQRQDMASLPEGFGESLTESVQSDPAKRFLTGTDSDDVGTPDTPQEGGNFGATALQFLPEVMDFATGVFAKDNVRPATTVNKGALSNFPNKVNVNPQLEAVTRQFRSIVSDPSASMNQKLAALSQTNQAVSQIHGEKTNRENQLAANKAQIEARLDSQQAQYNERHRQEKMRADANYGVTGNFARQAVANAAGKGLMMKAEKGQEKRDDIALAAVTAGLSDAARDKLFEILEGAK